MKEPAAQDAATDINDAGTPPDAGEKAYCDELKQIIQALVAQQTCNEASGCKRLHGDFPQNDPELCNLIWPADADAEKALSGLAAEWSNRGCGRPSVCAGDPGTPRCVGGRCVLSTECDTCLTLPEDPVCTTDGQTVRNRCVVENCLSLGLRVASEGPCPISDSCAQTGGRCVIASPDGLPCPVATKWNAANTSQGCTHPTSEAFCCEPWSQPCQYVSGAFELSHDLFDCTPAPAQCLVVRDPETCSDIAATLGDADVTLSLLDAGITLAGVDRVRHRSFHCEGKLTYSPTTAMRWSCTACDQDGGCQQCSPEQRRGCSL